MNTATDAAIRNEPIVDAVFRPVKPSDSPYVAMRRGIPS